MFQKAILGAVLTWGVLTPPVAAEIKFIRPGEKPLSQPPVSSVAALDLDALYRGIELTGRVRARTTREMIVATMMDEFAREDVDGKPGISDADRLLAADVEIAAKRANALRTLHQNDLDSDGVVTRGELVTVGRVQNAKKAQRHQPNGSVVMTAEQRETLVLDFVARSLAKDRDGDDSLTAEEVVAGLNEDQIRTRYRTEGGLVKAIWDVNADGVITESEMRQSLDRLLGLIDSNGDGIIDPEEAAPIRKAMIAAKVRADDPSRGKRVACSLPQVPNSAEVIVLQGESGTAVTNLGFVGPRDQIVRMTDVAVPEGGRDLYLLVSMRKPALVRLSGPGEERVKAVVGVAAPVAVTGGKASLANTPCHRGFLGIRIIEPGGVEKEFGKALGRDDVRALVADRLGRVDLGTWTNDPVARLAGDATPMMEGDGQVIVDRFLSYDPGGFQMPDPNRVQSTVPVKSRALPPLEIGLIVLASEGKIDFVAPEPDIVGTGTDGEARDGIAGWLKSPKKKPRGPVPLTVLVRRAIDLPAGLTTERSVRLIVPDGVPAPRGAKPVLR